MKIVMSSFGFFLMVTLLIVMAFFASAFPLEPKYAVVSSLSVIVFALPCYYGLIQTLGRKSALSLILIMNIFALILENFAIITGFPYGNFSYGVLIGQLVGYVPWTVGLAWTPILFGAISLSQRWSKKRSLWGTVGMAAILMTTLDFVLDPGSVALNFWTWENKVGFYGVPWSNFFGWMITSALTIFFVQKFLALRKVTDIKFSLWAHQSYFMILIFWTAICFFEQLWLPGFIGCGLLFILRKDVLSIHSAPHPGTLLITIY
jgi:putative membrane protein